MAEGIRVSTNVFQYAIWHVRLRAFLIDMVAVNLLVLLFFPGATKLFYILGESRFADLNVFLMGEGIGFLILPLVYLVVAWGLLSRTLGMWIMKIKVADANGKDIGWLKAVLRVFAFVLAVIPLYLGFLPVFFDKKRQGIHDKLTKTFVIMKR